LRSLLVIGQVAISVPLLTGAGLAVRSLWNLQQVDPGLETARVLAARVDLNWTRYSDNAKRDDFWRRAITEAEKIPSVQHVAVSGFEPLNGLVNYPTPFRIDGRPVQPGAPSPHATVMVTSEDYFATIGQPLLRGHAFRASDTRDAPPVVIINQSLASRHWPAEDPVGHRITFDSGKTWATIVGVVANARQQLDAESVDEIHLPLRAAQGLNSATVLVRTAAPPETLLRDVRESIRRVDPQQPVDRIETLAQVRDASIAPRRLVATLLALFALLALVITAAGIGGVLAFSVAQRTQEIGIRVALGACRSQVLWMVLKQGLALVGLGLGAGLVAAFLLSHLMASVLFGVPATDPLTFAAVIAVLLGVAVLACLLPARRATSINPMVALRAS